MTPHMRAVVKYGEDFIREESEESIKAAVKASTRATYSLAARACFFEGLFQCAANVGEYLTRVNDGKKYLVETLQIEPRSQGLCYTFLAMTNQIVTLARPVGVDAGSNRVTEWEIYAENVQAFMDTTTRSLKEQNDGLISQDITIIHIPARFGIRRLDRVYIVRKDVPLTESDYYRVESINDALIPLDELVDYTGIFVLQLTEDKRTGGVAEEPGGGVDPKPEPDPGYW